MTKLTSRRKLLVAAAGAVLLSAGSAVAAGKLTVVELFTSQGCSSCPPANANLGKLSHRSDVLALSFSVTYWDSLGWKDIFAKPEFTERQYAYEPGLGRSGPFTPQMVVNGRADTVGNQLSAVESLISGAKRGAGPDVSLGSGRVAVGAGGKPSQPADIWLVTYDPRTVNVAVGRGENSGRTLPHTNVVKSLRRIGAWSGDAVELQLPKAPAGLATAVLVQEAGGGAIVAAARH